MTAPEDIKHHVFIHVAVKEGIPIPFGPFDKIIDVDHDPPYIHLIVQIPPAGWDETHPLWKER